MLCWHREGFRTDWRPQSCLCYKIRMIPKHLSTAYKAVFTVAVALAVSLAATKTAVSADSSEPLIEQKRQQLEQARVDDLFFWERYLRRLDSPGQFPQPDSFYVPSQLIEGGASLPLASMPVHNRRISEAHWRSALDWALQRDTQVMVVARAGRVEFAHYGSGRDAGSLLPVRSIAKPLTAMAIGAAIADGSIRNIEQPIGEFLQAWRNDPRGRITIEQLLTMSSGLTPRVFPTAIEPTSVILQLAEGSDVGAISLAHPLLDEPGMQFAWGNVESQLLSMVIEAATGSSYRDYLQQKIWKPMGLGTSSLNVDREGQTRAFCCLRIRADDLLKIGLMLLNGGEWQGQRILPREWVELMFSPSAINPYHGYQTFIGWSQGGPRLAGPPLIVRNEVPFTEPTWFLGGLGGTTTLWLLPKRATAVLRFGNDPKEWENSSIINLLLTGETQP